MVVGISGQNTRMETAKRIEQVLLDAGVGPRQVRSTLAALCGISPQAVRAWYSGDTKRISPEYLAKIAEAYGISVEWLITGEGERRRSGNQIAGMLHSLPDAQRRALIDELVAELSSDEKLLFVRKALDGLDKPQ